MKTRSRLLVASTLVLGMIAATEAVAANPSSTSVIFSRHNLSSSRPTANITDANGDMLLGDIYVLGNGVLAVDASGNPLRDASGNLTGALAGPDVGIDTTQVCVFCHTPHGANNAIAVPLWNKASTGNSYKAYTMRGRDSTGTPSNTGGNIPTSSMSLACLTCHDGTQAMDAFMNAPGIHINSDTDGTGTSAGYQWAGSGTFAGGGDVVDGRLNGGRTNSNSETGPILGTDLSNDHPIGMTYCGKQTAAGVCEGANATEFVQPADLNPLIKIFADNGGARTATARNQALAANNVGGTVECASCHNPHGTGNQAFLRVPRTGSQICLACHVK